MHHIRSLASIIRQNPFFSYQENSENSSPATLIAVAEPHSEATEFFLDYLMHLGPNLDQSWAIHENHLNQVFEAVSSAGSEQERETVCRKMIRRWHQAIKENAKSPKRNGKKSGSIKL